MNILFIHQNFPGQFKYLAPALVQQGHTVVALSMQARQKAVWNGVQIIPYAADRGSSTAIHPWVGDFETKIIRAEACLRCAHQMLSQGFTPDVIIAHPGWGESLFLKDVWPKARLGIYCEFYYLPTGADVGFDPEFPSEDPLEPTRLHLKNLNNQLHFVSADAGISPTRWQASTFPEHFRSKIAVVYDGIDTQLLQPSEGASLTVNHTTVLTRADELITFVNRNLEPYRGYHSFMRALPKILRERPQARIMIVGGSDVSYGPRPREGGSWKDIYIKEVRPRLSDAEWSRIHFLGNIPYEVYIALLQLSSVHVYLTYPFVLSWSLMEAMSIGCAVVGSNTAPVQELIQSGVHGELVDFFSPDEIAEAVIDLLQHPERAQQLGRSARQAIVETYDVHRHCLPEQLAWVGRLADAKKG